MFRVGQKVCCINASGDVVPELTLHAIYTVSEISPDGEGITVWELEPYENDQYEKYYCAWRFRPVVERPTDISFAHAILRKASRQKEDVA